LKPKEYQLLLLLARNVGRIVPSRDVDRWLFPKTVRSSSNSVAVHLSRIRKALQGGRVSIKTFRGKGHCLVVHDAVP
jgi:DNA-binding response OmpR family regulator